MFYLNTISEFFNKLRQTTLNKHNLNHQYCKIKAKHFFNLFLFYSL